MHADMYIHIHMLEGLFSFSHPDKSASSSTSLSLYFCICSLLIAVLTGKKKKRQYREEKEWDRSSLFAKLDLVSNLGHCDHCLGTQ